MKRSVLVIALLCVLMIPALAQTTTVTFNNPANNGTTNKFTVPAGVTTITVQCWGGGGAGGGNTNGSNGGGGGGGGAFSSSDLTVVSGNTYNVNVGSGGTGSTGNGASGTVSWFGATNQAAATVLANGGSFGTAGGAGGGGAGGAGGVTTGGVGTTQWAGGTGGAGRTSTTGRGGGGGSSAGTGAVGNPGTSGAAGGGNAAGGTAPTGGYAGGLGGNTNQDGSGPGSAANTQAAAAGSFGAGGGGSGDNGGSNHNGGNGANGQVIISYTVPDVTGMTASAAVVCIGSGSTVTVSSSNLISDTYTVTYNVSGTNTVSSTTATMIFTAGSPGTGTFTTSALASTGASNVVNITKITSSTNNSSNASVSTAAFSTVASAPATPGSISGSTSMCQFATGLTYSISSVANATSYTWSVPTGWSITAGQGTTSVTVTAGSILQPGNISVTANNSCGSSAGSNLAVAPFSCATTYYSRQNGNWNSSTTWSTVSHASSTNTGSFPIIGDIVYIGGSDQVTVPQNVAAAGGSITVSDDGTTCSLFVGDATASNNPASLTLSADLTINSGGTVRMGSSTNNAARTANLSVVNMTLNGTGIFTLGNNSTSAAVSVTASGTLNMNGTSVLTIGSTNSNNFSLTVGSAVTISSNATLQSGGDGGGTHTINFQSTLTNSGNINFANGTDQVSLNVASSTSSNGTITFANNSGTNTFSGAVNNSGTWNSTGLTTTSSLIFQNGLSSSGTFSAGTATFTTNTQALGGSGAMSFANVVTVTGVTLTNGNSNTVTISGTGTGQLTGTGTWLQGSNSTLSYAGSTMTITAMNASSNSNTVIYTGATPTIFVTGLTSSTYNNLTYAGSTTGSIASASISGNLTCSSGTLSSSGTITFTGTSTQTVSGSGSFSFTNIIMSTGSSAKVAVNTSISVSGTISWTTDGLIVMGSSADLTLGTAASITTPTAARYIQLDGASSTNSNLIRTSGNNTTNWAFTFPIGTSTGGYTPVTIGSITTAPVNGSTLAVKAIVTTDVTGRLKRDFRFVVSSTNTNATYFSNASFSYNDATDISSGDSESGYNTAWLLNSGGTWSSVTGSVNTAANTFSVTGGNTTDASLTNGTYFYTCGSNISAQHTWYSYQTGNYSDYNIWTLDPSGTTFNNPANIYPTVGDAVHILNGFNVTVDLSGLTLSSTTIDGGATFDLSTTTGHNLGTITGTGILRVKGATLPIGTYTDFVSTTGGTIEFYDVGGTLSSSQTTYNKLKMTNSTGSSIIYVLVSDLTVNSTFNLSTTGAGTVTWQINDASNTSRTINLNGDLTVASGGKIVVGTGNQSSTSQHTVNVYGNITNSGTIQFFDPTDANLSATNYGITSGANEAPFYTAALRGNAATVNFLGTTNNTVTCNGQTDFYRFILNKGTGQQAILIVNSSNTSNFRLFGPDNKATDESSGISYQYVSANALSIVNGTLELMGSINIPVLVMANTSTSGYFPIPRNGALWLNGANVTVQIADLTTDVYSGNKDGRILMSGLLRITAGTLFDGFSKGLGSQDGGSYLQEGGTVSCWQFRPRAVGTGIFSFAMSGGTLNVGYGYALSGGKIDTYEEDYMRFDLNSINSTFQMSGGVLNVAKPTNNNGGSGGLFNVASTSGNYNVTGGTVNLYTGYESSGGTYPGYISSTAPLYNVTLNEEVVSGGSATTQTHQLQTNSLVVSNNLTINTGNNPEFATNGLNLTIGGNFNIQSGTTYTPGTSTITKFNGTGSQTWTHDGTITSLSASTVTVDKASGTLTLAGGQTFPNMGSTGATGGLILNSGTLADGGKTLTVDGAISNSGTHSGTGKIIVTTATTIGGSNGTFGNLRITTNNTVATSGNQTVTGTLELNGSSTCKLNISSYSLTVSGSLTTSGTFGTNYNIQTNGLYSAGGLTLKGAAGDILFPVGSNNLYTPNTINVTATTYGTITVRPVNSEHPNVTNINESLKYYWRVVSSGFSGVTSVSHKTYSFSSITKSGSASDIQSYRSARFDATSLTWGTNNTIFDATSVTVIPNFNTGTGWTGVSGDKLDGEYTCGNALAFGNVQPYYSKGNGAWNAATGVWTASSSHSGTDIAGPPCSTCPVVIGDGATINHSITIDANGRNCGTLTINTGSTLDCASYTGLNFGTSTGGAVTGQGKLRVSSASTTAAFPTGDFSNFIGSSGGSVEWYTTTTNFTIPSTYTGPNSSTQNLNSYYNLVLNPNAGNITLPASNLSIYNTWVQQTGAGTITNNGARTLAITGDMTISSGTFSLTNSGNTTITVGGSVTNNGTFSTASGTHTLTVNGSITNNNTINFNNTGTVAITFTGSTTPVSFTGTGTGGTTLSTVTVNKGSSQTPVVIFDLSGTVTAATSGWLTLTNGTFYFNNSSTYTIVSTSGSYYTIPSTAKLKVGAGTVNVVSAGNNSSDLYLNGALEVTGGTVNVGNSANNNNNDIEYASSGSPTITVSGGSLYVNGSIRRSTSTITGALVYNQTGGTVTVGGRSSDATRGVFEIDSNTGSSFTLTGTSSLIVQRQTNGTGYADVFINPVSSSVSSTSIITVGLSTSGTTQGNLRVNIAPAIGNFSVANGGGANTQTVKLYSNAMVLGGTLTIPTPSVLTTNSLNVSIAGDFNCTGTYNAGSNTTTFNGTGAQSATLSTNTNFYNVTISKSAGTTLTLSGTAPTAPALNNLNLLTGVLDVGSIGLTVNRNITINSSQVGSGSIIVYSTGSASNTITSSGGSFTNLTLGGTASSRTVNVSGNLTINGALTFGGSTRYLMIASNQLTFGTSASISGANSTNFIETNGVSSDLGVTRIWPSGSGTFKYEVGTSTNYTPVTFTSFNPPSSGGTLNVIPVNSAHPTSSGSTDVLLNYYWTITNNLPSSTTRGGSIQFDYPSSLFTNSGVGTPSPAYLDDSNPTGWIVNPPNANGGTASLTQMIFANSPSTNFPANGNSYDYCVGDANSLPNPIVPLYSRLGVANVANTSVGGSWSTASNWTTDTDGDLDLNNPSSVAPIGVPVVILAGARINLNTNGRKAFKTTINGLLDNSGSKTGHSLGIITGTGTFRTATNTFPAGNYTAFVASGGGTVEYIAPMTMNSLATYNNLSIYSGSTGTVSMTASDLTINGNVTIPASTVLDNTSNNANMSVAGNWTNNGTFNAGTGTVTFNGGIQSITGTTTFNNFTMNSTGSVSLGSTTTINGALTLTSGKILSNSYPSTPLLQLSSSATTSGGSASSFVSGQIRKSILSGNSFVFPLGSTTNSLYRPATVSSASADDNWDASYVGNDPTLDGYSSASFNSANMVKVSTFEYWMVSNSSGTTSAGLTLSYGTGSYGTPDIGDPSQLKTARWNGSQWDVPPGGGTFSYTGDNFTGTVSVSFQNAFSPQTIASTDPASALPIELLYFTGEEVEEGVQLNWKTLSETTNNYFTVLHSTDGENFVELGKVKGNGTTSVQHSYTLTDENPVMGLNYYRLKQTDFDGKTTTVGNIRVMIDHLKLFLHVYPNPTSHQQLLNVEINGLQPNQSIGLQLFNAQGLSMRQAPVQADDNGVASVSVSPTDLPSGVYILTVGPRRVRIVIL